MKKVQRFRNSNRGFKVKAYKQDTDSGTIWVLYQKKIFQIILKEWDFNRRYEPV